MASVAEEATAPARDRGGARSDPRPLVAVRRAVGACRSGAALSAGLDRVPAGAPVRDPRSPARARPSSGCSASSSPTSRSRSSSRREWCRTTGRRSSSRRARSEPSPADVALFVIVTIPSDPTAMTVNLMAPVVVDVRTRRSRQLVLEDGRSDPSYRVCAAPPAGRGGNLTATPADRRKLNGARQTCTRFGAASFLRGPGSVSGFRLVSAEIPYLSSDFAGLPHRAFKFLAPALLKALTARERVATQTEEPGRARWTHGKRTRWR